MGLAVTVVTGPLKHLELPASADPHEWADEHDAHRVWVNEAFPEHAEDLQHGAIVKSAATRRFTVGSYTNYGDEYRHVLGLFCGAPPEAVWEDPDTYRDRPFYWQVNFSDCEGVIGPRVAAKLATDYLEYADELAKHAELRRQYERDALAAQRRYDWCMRLYGEFARAFNDAAATGGFVAFG